MKVNILQFENATMQALHEKAATVANAQVVYGPFVGAWWEHYLSVVIETAQVEQRVASSKDIAEIRGFYDTLAADLDKVTADRDQLSVAMERETQLRGIAETEANALRATAAERAEAEAARMQLVKDQSEVIKSLHKQLSAAATVNDQLRQKLEPVAQFDLPMPPAIECEPAQGEAGNGPASETQLVSSDEESSKSTESQKPVYDNPATYTARPNPFIRK